MQHTGRSEKSAAAVVASHREGLNGKESVTTVRHGETMHQKSVGQYSLQMELPLEDRGEAPTAERSGEVVSTTRGHERLGLDDVLMQQVVERGNLMRALHRVRQNKGSAGVDGRTAEELTEYLREHWKAIREQLLSGRYRPSAVKRVEIPKPGGGVRMLGIHASISWLQLLVCQGKQRQTSRITESLVEAEGAHPGDHVPERGTQLGQRNGCTAELSHGLEGVFPTRGHTGRLFRCGSMAPPSAAHAHAQTVEARTDDVSRAATPRSRWSSARYGGPIRSELVACGSS